MEKCIKIAIENGWKLRASKYRFVKILGNDFVFAFTGVADDTKVITPYEICLDPLFWQALEKGISTVEDTYDGKWRRIWHRFIDHLAEGKDIDSFFTNIIN